MKKILFASLLAFSSAAMADYKITFSASNVQLPESIAASVSKIDCGYYHCYALVNNIVWSIGYNAYGQLGREGTTDQSTWAPTNISSVSDIVAGAYHGYALKNDGTVWAVGYNNFGQLGISGKTEQLTWEQTSLTNISTIASGFYHGYAIKNY